MSNPAQPPGRAAITWPARVSKRRISRLYDSIRTGFLDEKLVDDVGISIYLRCRAILTIDEARHGHVLCPVCDRAGGETKIARAGHAREEVITCASCSWSITWADYQASFQRKQFNKGGAGDAFVRFVREYPACRTPWEKMVAIDLVIHAFHYSLRQDPTKPTRAACVNLIEGRLSDVVACLNAISGAAEASDELAGHHAEWHKNCRRAGQWHPR